MENKPVSELTKSDLIKILTPFVILIIVCNIGRVLNPPKEVQTVTIDTCSQAKEYLEKALNARDAITPEEAMTTEGRAKWTELRDAGVEARQLKEKLCGS